VQGRRTRERQLREAVARGVRTAGRTVALRAANPAVDASAGLTAEPLPARVAAVGATPALGAAFAEELIAGDGLARPGRREAWVARAAAAADAARDGAERDAGPREEEAGAERSGSEPFEELAPRRALGQ
jgi:hypothetical protein